MSTKPPDPLAEETRWLESITLRLDEAVNTIRFDVREELVRASRHGFRRGWVIGCKLLRARVVEFAKLENVLRRETSCIAPADVASLLVAIHAEAGVPVPSEIAREANENEAERDGAYGNPCLAVVGDPVSEDEEPVDYDGPPKFCPYCGGQNITVDMVQWMARSLEPQDATNAAKLDENQCSDCGGRSFWS